MRWLVSFLACLFLCTGHIHAADVVVQFNDEAFEFDREHPAVGFWLGNMHGENSSAVVTLEIRRDGDAHSVHLTCLALQALNAECVDVQVDERKISFALRAGIEMRFEMQVSENGQRLQGTRTTPARGEKPERTAPIELARTPRPMTLPTAKAYTGAIKIPNMGELKLTIVLATTPAGHWVGHADVPQQGIFGLALVNVAEDDAGVITATLPVPMYPAVVEASIDKDKDRLVGRFKQAMLDLEVDLPRESGYVAATLKRPQHPKPPYPYETREVMITTKEGFDLAGTLSLPKEGGPFPAAIMITGSGQQDRDETIFGHKPFAVIADHLTRNGIAVLRCDDRGVGGSGGLDIVETSTSRDFANDVIAQTEFLQTINHIDASRIGLIGHSEGGLIAPMVAAERNDIAFLILLAGPGVNGADILKVQGRKLLEAEGMSTEVIDDFLAVQQQALALAVSDAPEDEIREKITRMIEEQQAAMTGAASTQPDSQPDSKALQQQIEAQLQMITSPWMKYFLAFDPQPTLRKVKCPVLAVNGTLDLQVWHEQNLPEIEEAIASSGGDVTIKRYDGLNHMFQPAKTGGIGEYAAIETTFDAAVLDDMVRWLKEKVTPGHQ